MKLIINGASYSLPVVGSAVSDAGVQMVAAVEPGAEAAEEGDGAKSWAGGG